MAARTGSPCGTDGSQLDLIRELAGQGVLPREVAELFHVLRQAGNEAVHGFGGSTGEVVHHLKVARELGVWFHRTFANPAFAPGPFTRPQPPADPTAELNAQLEELRAERDRQRQRLEEELRREAERRAHLAAEDREAALHLAGEMEELLAAERARLQAERRPLEGDLRWITVMRTATMHPSLRISNMSHSAMFGSNASATSRNVCGATKVVADPAKWFTWIEGIAVATLLVLAACTTNERSSGVVERDSSGVTLVEYQANPSSIPTWTISDSATLTIGSVEGPGATTFGRIGRAGVEKAPGLARLSDGTIVVADQLSRRVHAFDARGRHSWSMGGKGGGPSEFNSISGVFLMAGDSVGVYDGSARQLKVVSPGGAYVRQVPIAVNASVVSARGVLSNGDILVTSTENMPLVVGPVRPLQSVRVLSPSGELGVEIGKYYGQEQIYYDEGGRRGVRRPYMARDGLLAGGRARVAFTSQDTFEVTIANPVASTQTLFRIQEEPLRVDHAVRARYIDEQVRRAERNGITRSRSDFDEGVFPQTVPAIARLEFDEADRLWVERYSIAADSARVWYVIGKDGHVEARATVPADFEVAAIGERDVVGIYRDELDVPFIQVRTIEKR